SARARAVSAGRGRAARAGRMVRFMMALAACGVVRTLILPPELEAQSVEELRRQAVQPLGRPISGEEILTRLRRSGLPPDQIRAELESRGYDPNVADSYLEVLEGRATTVRGGTDPVPVLEVVTDETSGAADSAAIRTLVEDGPPVFGRELFRRASTEFQPV